MMTISIVRTISITITIIFIDLTQYSYHWYLIHPFWLLLYLNWLSWFLFWCFLPSILLFPLYFPSFISTSGSFLFPIAFPIDHWIFIESTIKANHDLFWIPSIQAICHSNDYSIVQCPILRIESTATEYSIYSSNP